MAGDVVALKATTGTDKIVSVLQRHGIRVVVANTRKLKSISEAKAKTDRLDARTLARLLMGAPRRGVDGEALDLRLRERGLLLAGA